MTEWARAALGRALPERAVAAVETVPRGNHKETAVATLADGERVVVQRSARAAFRTELALLSAVGDRTDIPVPAVLATVTGDGATVAVLEHVAGADLHERFVSLAPAARASVARSFGRALASLHAAFEFEAYGPVRIADGEGRTFVAEGPTDWPGWFETYAREGAAALPAPLSAYREPVRSAVADASLPARPPARLYPWDLRPGNALVADGELTGLVDWDAPLAAAPGLALAKTEHLVADWYVSDPGPLRAALREGYREVAPLPDVPRVYRLVAVVRSAVDSRGTVTRPGYPERTGEDAAAFHRERIETLLQG